MQTSAIFLRDQLLKHVIDNTVNQLLLCSDTSKLPSLPSAHGERHMVPADPKFLYQYHKLYILSMYKAKEIAGPDPVQVESLLGHESGMLINGYEALMQNDLDNLNYFMALVAWLTIDDFRWHYSKGFEHIRTDLSYGLVLSYPILITNLGKFIVGFDRHCLNEIDHETYKTLDNIAKNDANYEDNPNLEGLQIPRRRQ